MRPGVTHNQRPSTTCNRVQNVWFLSAAVMGRLSKLSAWSSRGTLGARWAWGRNLSLRTSEHFTRISRGNGNYFIHRLSSSCRNNFPRGRSFHRLRHMWLLGGCIVTFFDLVRCFSFSNWPSSNIHEWLKAIRNGWFFNRRFIAKIVRIGRSHILEFYELYETAFSYFKSVFYWPWTFV